MMTKRDRLLFFVIIVLIVIMPIGLILVSRRSALHPRAKFGNATLALSPAEVSLAPGETATLALSIDSGDHPLSGIDVSFGFNSGVINISSITLNSSNGFTDTLVNEIGQSSARFSIVARQPTSDLPKGNITLATLTIDAIGAGTSPLEIRPNEIVGFNSQDPQGTDVRLTVGGKTDSTITVTAGQRQEPTPTLSPAVSPTLSPAVSPAPTPTPTPMLTVSPQTPLITFKTDFVGMGKARPDITVRLTIVNETELNPEKVVYHPLTAAGPDGAYRPTQTPYPLVGMRPGKGLTILLKGPKHLQKRVSDRIELKSGDNELFDWTAADLKLEPGDLPDPNNDMAQDGVVNAVDVGLMLDILENRFGSQDEKDLQVADLNYDGIINTFDLGLLIDTLSTKYDDEF